MSTTTIRPSGVKQVERTFRVERNTPSSGAYTLAVHREIISYDTDGTTEIGRVSLPFAFNESVAKVASMKATAAYMAALAAAKSATDAQVAEAAWYDALVAERRAEIAAQAPTP